MYPPSKPSRAGGRLLHTFLLVLSQWKYWNVVDWCSTCSLCRAARMVLVSLTVAYWPLTRNATAVNNTESSPLEATMPTSARTTACATKTRVNPRSAVRHSRITVSRASSRTTTASVASREIRLRHTGDAWKSAQVEKVAEVPATTGIRPVLQWRYRASLPYSPLCSTRAPPIRQLRN